MKVLFFLIFIAALGNTIFRPEIEHPLTLYRILAPIGLIAMFLARPMLVTKMVTSFLFFVVYNIGLAAAYGGGYSELGTSLIHYFYIFVLLILFVGMKHLDPDFDEHFLRFLQVFYAFLIFNLFVELFTGSYYPNLYVDIPGGRSLRAFYWNENDLAVVLGMVVWLVLALDRYRGAVRTAVAAITVLVLYYNDSKAALFSLLFISIPVAVLMHVGRHGRIAGKMRFFASGALGIIAVYMLLAFASVDLPFASTTYSLENMLVRPIQRILALEASGETWGSLNNRTDAAIFVIIEYLRTGGLGLGAGGSWLVLSMSEYRLGGAMSPHNALLQFVVDFGYPVLLGYVYLLRWAFRKFLSVDLGERDRLKVIAIFSFPLLGLSQSGAIVTNFFFWGVLYFIWFQGRVPFQATQSIASARRSGTMGGTRPAASAGPK